MSNHSTKSLRGDELRDQILSTALQMFADKGYFNTSIHDIRKEAGVSTGAIYHHFKNKEALAKSLYESLLIEIDNDINDVCKVHTGSYEKSRAIIKKMFALTMENPITMQFILMAQHREYLPDEPPICSSKPFQSMKNVISEGIKNQEIKNIDVWVAATTMFGGALRMMGLQLDGVLNQPLSDYLDEVVECAWLGIKQ